VNLRKAISIWLLIVFAESVNGTIREFFIAPAIGDRSTRQIGFVVGSALILFIAWLTAPWLRAETFKAQLKVGGLWLMLIVAFEFGLGYARGFSGERMLSDYNLAQGGLMSFGLVILLLAPAFGARLRTKGRKPDTPHSSGPR
jgi:hypothetical protein